MLQIPLQAIAKQSLSVVLDGINYSLDVLATAGVMSMNVTRGTDLVAQGQRVVAGQPCIQSGPSLGNFIFLTSNDELPNYTEFGNTQFLIYASQAEIDALFLAEPAVRATLRAAATVAGAAVFHGVGHV